MRYAITYVVHGTATTIVDLDAPPTAEEAADHTEQIILCHQCSGEVDMGDPGEILEIYEIDEEGEYTPIFEREL
jgi:hypothetical protein